MGHILPFGVAAFNRLYRDYIRDALRRNIPFALTREEFQMLTRSDCYYCGVEPHRAYDKNGGNGEVNGAYVYNGVDRVDNTQGYILVNCVPCCFVCNRAKSNRTEDEFIAWIMQIAKRFENGEIIS